MPADENVRQTASDDTAFPNEQLLGICKQIVIFADLASGATGERGKFSSTRISMAGESTRTRPPQNSSFTGQPAGFGAET